MIRFEEQAVVRADPEIIFSIYENVESWCRWDPDVQSASIAGAFVPGTAGTLKPRNGPSVGMRLTQVDRNRSFTDETSLPLCRMKFEHHLVREGKGTRVIHRVSFSGPLAFFSGGSSGDRSSAGCRKLSDG